MLHRNVRLTMGWLVAAALGLGACSSDNNYEPAPNPVPPPSEGATTVRLAVTSKPTSGTTGTAVVTPVVVKATDVNGNALVGQQISFTLTSGGTLQRSSATTDAQGLASPGTWTLGNLKGNQRLVASAGGSSVFVDVNAVVTVGAFDSVVSPLGLNGGSFIAGAANALTFVAVDSFNNRLGAGVPIAFVAKQGTLSSAGGNTSAAGAVATTWTLPTIIGKDTLIVNYTVRGAPAADTIVVKGGCTLNPFTTGSTITGTWTSTDCRTATQRRDEYAVAFGDNGQSAFGGSGSQRNLVLTGGAGQSLGLVGVNDALPAYLGGGTSPTTVRYVVPPGTYTAQANSPGLTDAIYTLAQTAQPALASGAYLASISCPEAGAIPTYVASGTHLFNIHRGSNTCNGGGYGDFQDRYLIQLAAGQSVHVELFHWTPGIGANPWYNLYLKDANTAAGPTVATAADPANADAPDPWVIDYTSVSGGLYEIIVGVRPGLAPSDMDYELVVK